MAGAEARLKGTTEIRLSDVSIILAVQVYFDALFETGASPIVEEVQQEDDVFIIRTSERPANKPAPAPAPAPARST